MSFQNTNNEILSGNHMYKNRFKNKDAVKEYVKLYSNKSNYPSLLYSIEKKVLNTIVSRLKQEGLGERYLDFAVGTGRILTHLEGFFNESEGIDISPEMVTVSSHRSASSNIRCADITQETPIERGYDLITAFRFFLNAEPELRESIMRALSQNLQDDNSVLIVNNHGRIPSVKLIKHIYQELTFRIAGKPKNHVFLSDATFESLIIRHGLRIDSEYSYGILSSRISKLIGYRASEFIETTLAGSFLAQLIGSSKIYVIRLN